MKNRGPEVKFTSMNIGGYQEGGLGSLDPPNILIAPSKSKLC
jgi:hypothetical protein